MRAARAGDRQQAKDAFIRALRVDPRQDLTWLCLASVTDSLQMRLVYLSKAVELNPKNEGAAKLLGMAKSHFADELVDRGSAYMRAEDTWSATHCLLHAIELDPGNESAWLRLARLDDPPESREMLLERVLEINPENQQARMLLDEALAPSVETNANEVITEVQEVATELDAVPCLDIPPDVPEEVESPPQLSLEPELPEAEVEIPQPVSETPPALALAIEPEPEPEPTPLPEPLERLTQCPFCEAALAENQERCEACEAVVSHRAFLSGSGATAQSESNRRQTMIAAARYNRMTAQNPGDAAAYYKLGLAYLNLRHPDAALRSLQRAGELRPDADLSGILQWLADAKAQQVASASAAANRAPEGPKKNGHSILVIDDSPTVRKAVTLTLEKYGYSVVTAIDGQDGLAKFQKCRASMVFLDIMMPKMDGYQVCKAIRETKRDIPVVMLSGKDGFFDKVRGKMAGSTAYITKPFQPRTLVETAHQYCKGA